MAAIQRSAGAHSETVGTGFLVRGADFGPGLAEDKSYVLTNAHVLWDEDRGQGRENTALSPREARIVFESDHKANCTTAGPARAPASPSSAIPMARRREAA